jgi:proteasome lid subunit RPN8/RPN11
MNEINVSINRKNLNKILHYAQAAYDEYKAEIGGMAVCVKGDDNEWTIENPIILKQEITGTNCTLDQVELANYYADTAANKKYKNKDWRFLWWHSHHMMSAFWSGTDLNAIEEFNEGDLSFALVVNLKGEYLVRASAWMLGIHQDMDLDILETTAKIPEKVMTEVDEKCSTRTYITYDSLANKNINQLSFVNGIQSSIKKSTKEEETFSELWLAAIDDIEELISDTCKGLKTIKDMKAALARMNGKLANNHSGIRINYSSIHSVDDLLTIKGHSLIEVDSKFSEIHDELIVDAEDTYAWNWSYGLNGRYI